MAEAGEPYELLEAGTEFWHVYKEPFVGNGFNPQATGRFSARDATPRRAMLYAGDTSDCALWETLLRDIVPAATPPHAVDVPLPRDYRIAQLKLTHDARMLDLGPFGVRRLAGTDLARRDRITMLTTVPKYPATHKEAAKLLAAFPDAAGMLWPSRQTGSGRAYVFYAPPLAAEGFEALRTVDLDSPEGTALIDQALTRAGLRRLDSSTLAVELGEDLPKEPHDP